MEGLERDVGRRFEDLEQGAHPETALMRLVDEAVDLVQRRHHVQKENRQSKDFTIRNPSADEQVNSASDDNKMEEAFVQRLAAAEERHLKVMPQLGCAAAFGGLRDSPDFLLVSIGGTYVV